MINTSAKLATVLILLILILAAFLRFYKLAEIPPGLYPDEAMYGNNAIEALVTKDFRVFYPENNGREGLYINILAIAISIFGNEPWTLRLVSAIFGILTVLGIYLLTRELINVSEISKSEYQNQETFRASDLEFRISGGNTIALLAAFFVAASFWHINFSRIGFRAISAPFFLVFGFYFLLRAFHGIGAKKGVLHAAFAGAFLGLGFHTYIAYRFLPLLLALVFYLIWKDSDYGAKTKAAKVILACIAATTIFALPIGLYFIQHTADFAGRAVEVSVLKMPLKETAFNLVKTLGMFTFYGDRNWRHNVSGWPLLNPLVGTAFIVGFIASAAVAMRSRFKSFQHTFLLAWFFVMLGANFLAPEGSPHALRALVALPAVFVISAIGANHIWSFINARMHRYRANILGITLIAAIAFTGWFQYFVLWYGQPKVSDAFSANYVAEARFLQNLAKESHKYVITNAGGIPIRELPASAQTVVFLLGGWDESRWNVQNARFVREEEFDTLEIEKPAVIVLMQRSSEWEQKIENRFPEAAILQKEAFAAYNL